MSAAARRSTLLAAQIDFLIARGDHADAAAVQEVLDRVQRTERGAAGLPPCRPRKNSARGRFRMNLRQPAGRLADLPTLALVLEDDRA